PSLPPDPHGRGGGGVPGERQGGAHLLGVAGQHANVGCTAALQTACHTSRPEARCELGRIELLELRRRRHPARAKEGLRGGAHEIPSPSGNPSIRLRFWIAWEAAPFQRLSIEAKAIARPDASFCARCIRQRLVPRTPLTPGGSDVTSTNGSFP